MIAAMMAFDEPLAAGTLSIALSSGRLHEGSDIRVFWAFPLMGGGFAGCARVTPATRANHSVGIGNAIADEVGAGLFVTVESSCAPVLNFSPMVQVQEVLSEEMFGSLQWDRFPATVRWKQRFFSDRGFE